MTLLSQPTPLDQWRRRLGDKGSRRAQPRPFGALGYLAGGSVLEGPIEISKLVLVVLYDERGRDGRCALRLAGYGGTQVPWGVKWGGAEQCRFFKDLRLEPVPEARGARLDANRTELLRLGLQLQRDLDRHYRYRQLAARRTPMLPNLWAGFRLSDAATITGDGPEFDAECRRKRRSPKELMVAAMRTEFGLVLYLLPWVSHHWQRSLGVFADLTGYPRRQVFRLSHPADDLVGFQGAAQFDFLHSRFRSAVKRRPRCQKRPVLASV